MSIQPLSWTNIVRGESIKQVFGWSSFQDDVMVVVYGICCGCQLKKIDIQQKRRKS